MIKSISALKYWQIAVIGVVCSVTVMLLVAFAARVITVNWPDARDGIHIAYLIIAAAAAWIITGVFIEAAFYKARKERVEFLRDEALDAISDLYSAFKFTPGAEYNGRRDDEYPDVIDLDELAVELGLVEKKEDCG